MKFKFLQFGFWIVFFVMPAVAAQANSGSLEVIPEEVRSGEPIEFEITVPDDDFLIDHVRIFKAPALTMSDLFSSIAVPQEDQETVGHGNKMHFTVDTLDYPPGTYHFVTHLMGGSPRIYDTVEILPRDNTVPSYIADDMLRMGSVLGLYREWGEVILPSESVFPGESLVLAVNLNLVGAFDNSVRVDLSGETFYLSDLMQIKIIRAFDLSKRNLSGLTDACDGAVDTEGLEPSDGIAVVSFRAPEHKKYYEYDGKIDFVLNARLPVNQGCQQSIESLSVTFDDDPAADPIPDFETYNGQNFPGEPVRNNFNHDFFDVRIVRVSTSTESLLASSRYDSTILAGETYGDYAVESIEADGAPLGVYTFSVVNPTDGIVFLLKDGTPVDSLRYDWQTTIASTDSSQFYTFEFPGYFSITIRKAGSGTMNLYGMENSIFNGVEQLSISNRESLPGVDTTEMDELIDLLEETFHEATKGYFRITVSGVEFIDYMTDEMIADAISWYDSVPKTPHLPVLDGSEPDQLSLIVGLYIRLELGDAPFADWYTQIYPKKYRGEDMTLYVVDHISTLGTAMGAGAARISKQRIYNLKCTRPDAIADSLFFQTDSSGATTYHYAMSNCSAYTDTMEKYLEQRRSETTIARVVDTMIHEMGHVLWIDPIGLSLHHNKVKMVPSREDTVYVDYSDREFAHYEYMSYARNRGNLENMTYGDENIERLLYYYGKPELTVESLTHGEENNTVTIEQGESVDYLLRCNAPSGTRSIEYRQISGPASTPSYVRSEYSNSLQISLQPEEVGTHVYSATCKDKLYPTWGHQHSDGVSFTIEVLEKESNGTLFVGGVYGDYAIESIELDGARTGDYSFHVDSPTAGIVILKKDSVPVYRLNYDWKKKVSSSDPRKFYTFDFPGNFSITVRKAGQGKGKINLSALGESIFNGIEILKIKQFRNERP